MFGRDAGSRRWKIPLLPVIRTKTSRECLRLNHGPRKGVRWGGWRRWMFIFRMSRTVRGKIFFLHTEKCEHKISFWLSRRSSNAPGHLVSKTWNETITVLTSLTLVLGPPSLLFGRYMGSFPKGKAEGTQSWPRNSVRLRMSAAISPLPLYAFKSCTRRILPLSFDRRRRGRK